jgi:hypothetical protein
MTSGSTFAVARKSFGCRAHYGVLLGGVARTAICVVARAPDWPTSGDVDRHRVSLWRPQIAAITGHSPRDVDEILKGHYLEGQAELADQAIVKYVAVRRGSDRLDAAVGHGPPMILEPNLLTAAHRNRRRTSKASPGQKLQTETQTGYTVPLLSPAKSLKKLGGRTRARTWDPMIKSQPRVKDNQ